MPEVSASVRRAGAPLRRLFHGVVLVKHIRRARRMNAHDTVMEDIKGAPTDAASTPQHSTQPWLSARNGERHASTTRACQHRCCTPSRERGRGPGQIKTGTGEGTHRLRMSTSAFLQTMLANRRPIPLMAVMAYMTFCLPSTLVFSTRRMCWNSSPATRDCAAGDQILSARERRQRSHYVCIRAQRATVRCSSTAAVAPAVGGSAHPHDCVRLLPVRRRERPGSTRDATPSKRQGMATANPTRFAEQL